MGDFLKHKRLAKFHLVLGGILSTLGIIGYTGLCCTTALIFLGGLGIIFIILSVYNSFFLMIGAIFIILSVIHYHKHRTCG